MPATEATSRKNSIRVNPFVAVPDSNSIQDKPYERMTPAQKRWADIVQRRTKDPSWNLHGEVWDALKFELHYLCGYTWLPTKESGGFMHGGVELLKSVGLLVINHFWMHNPRRVQEGLDPEVGISVKLYKVTFDDQSGEICFGYNGQGDDLSTSACFAKNLAFMPYAEGHGGIIDPAKTPALFEAALNLEEYITLAATEKGRNLIEQPVFPGCLYGFNPNSAPTIEDADVSALMQAVCNYVFIEDEKGKPINGDVLEALQTKKPIEIASVTHSGERVTLKTTLDEIIELPRCVVLRANVKEGTSLKVGDVLGDFAFPTDAKLSNDNLVDDFTKAVGNYATDWILQATWGAAATRHQMVNVNLVCYPHVLVPELASRAATKFIDMRDELGREILSPDLSVAKVKDNEARLHVFHMHQSICAEALQFSGNGFRADLYSTRPYWEKHFRCGKAPMRNGGQYSRKRAA